MRQSSEHRELELRLLLQALNVPARIEAVQDRKRVQKAIYLAQAAGVDLGYRYGWYLLGPYCPTLARDYYEFFSTPTPSQLPSATLRPIAQRNLATVRGMIDRYGAIGATRDDWLELLASIRFLASEKELDAEHIRKTIDEKKPHLAEWVTSAVATLSEFGFL